jgi:hypothetical protein
MTLQTSGAISLNDVQTEFGGGNPIGINEYYAGGASVPSGTSGTNGAVPSSGQISLSNFYGTGLSVSISDLYISDIGSGTQYGYYFVTAGGKIQYSTQSDGINPIDHETWCSSNTGGSLFDVRVTVTAGILSGNATSTWLSMSGGTRSWFNTTTFSGDNQYTTFTVDLRRTGNTTILDTATITIDLIEF